MNMLNSKFNAGFVKAAILAVILCVFTGCVGQQAVKWNTLNANIDTTQHAVVTIKTTCEVPPDSVSYLQADIQKQVDKVLTGSPKSPNPYNIEVTITRYDEGNAFARSMLIGMGQMYLDGTVDVKFGTPPNCVRQGEFKKNFCVGGMIGGAATMQGSMLSRVGKDVADALKEQK